MPEVEKKHKRRKRPGFTLLELLVVIGILAVLVTIVVLVINPLEYIKQSKDAKRIGDVDTLYKMSNLADFEGVVTGSASTIYISIPDTSTTCANLGLPAAPSGYTWHCVPAATLQEVDGTGWIPINTSALPAGSPIATLPVDPTNTVAGGYFYTFIPKVAISAMLESDRYAPMAVNDGGSDPTRYEKGGGIAAAPVIPIVPSGGGGCLAFPQTFPIALPACF